MSALYKYCVPGPGVMQTAQGEPGRRDPCGGVLYELPGEEGLASGLEAFEALEPRIVPAELRHYAERFSEQQFACKMMEVLGASSRSSHSA